MLIATSKTPDVTEVLVGDARCMLSYHLWCCGKARLFFFFFLIIIDDEGVVTVGLIYSDPMKEFFSSVTEALS